jgi:hypothetical protein
MQSADDNREMALELRLMIAERLILMATRVIPAD